MKYKKSFRKAAILLLTVVVFLSSAVTAKAADATNYTYTISADGEWQRTQDAYLTSKILFSSAGLSQPNDIFVYGNTLYVADTGNKRILALDFKEGHQFEFGTGILSSPMGVFVTNEGNIYVTDTAEEAVFVFSKAGELIKTYKRPETATFGKNTQYIPSKIAVNSAGIMYVVSEGSYDGMVQIDNDGNFLGYFGYNNNPMTITDYLQDIFFTEEQKSKLFNRVPYSFKNLDIDSKGLIYSVTMSVKGNAVKRHDISGRNLLNKDMNDEENFVDVAVGNYGQIYALTQTGLLFEYDTDGNLLFSSGGVAIQEERNGLFTTSDAIDVDSSGNLYILDRERGLVHVLSPTQMASSVHQAMDLYNNGHYEESAEMWKQIAVICGNSRIVENGIANCMFQMQNYDGAAKHYRIAENRDGYSDAYWQIRSRNVSDYLPYAILIVLLAVVITFVLRRYYKKNHLPKEISAFQKDIKLIRRALIHPIDSFYAIRRENAGHIGTATLLYLAAYIVFACNFLFRGFVISYTNPDNTSLLYVTVLFAVPVFLFVFSNFFIGEINDSEARFRDVYIATSYVMSPFIVFMPFIILLSHIMTQAEGRLLGIATFAIYAWVMVLLFISTKEIHAYNIGNVVKNLLITLFLLFVIVLAASLIGMFWDQLFDFVVSVIGEVKNRVL